MLPSVFYGQMGLPPSYDQSSYSTQLRKKNPNIEAETKIITLIKLMSTKKISNKMTDFSCQCLLLQLSRII